MDYIYTIIYRFEGISDNNLVEDKIVYQDDALDITVLLTNDINRHCLNLDTGLACASLLLRGMFGGEKLQELPIAIDAEVRKMQKERRSKKKSGAYAVILIKGNADLDINENLQIETDQFRICFDAIDKKFIQSSVENMIDRKLVEVIISLSNAMNISVIAEGVESEAQLDIIKGLSCDLYQGYLFSKALSYDDTIKLIEETKKELVEIKSPIVYLKDEEYEINEDNGEIEKLERMAIGENGVELVLPTLFPVENVRLINEVYTEDIFWNGYEEKGAVDNLKAMIDDYFSFLNVWK